MSAVRLPRDRAKPVVLVAVRHPVLRVLIERHLAGPPEWRCTALDGDELLVHGMARTEPDVLIVDTYDFPECCRASLDTFPADRVIVVGPEPDAFYRRAALAAGAGDWLARDELGESLRATLRRVLAHLVTEDARDCSGARAMHDGEITRRYG